MLFGAMGCFEMSIRFDEYNYGYRVVSFAQDCIAKDKLVAEGLSVVYLDENTVTLVMLPEEIILSDNPAHIEKARMYNNYDVFEIWENGVFSRKYNDKSDDNYFFITGKCNSNCIMCPSPEHSRKGSETIQLGDLMELARHIPSDAPHLTITGGEPFLMGEQIFTFLHYLKEKFDGTEFLFLTNGRIFAVEKYLQQFCETAPGNSIVAIPVHGSCQQIHDAITRTDGSFKQTILGIKKLLKKGVPVEVRLVVSKKNVEDFDNMRQDNMIHYSLDPHDFDYIWPEGYMPNAKISGVVPVKGCGTTTNLKGIELQFTNGRKLCIHSSDLIPGAMDSQIV